jgi:succinoglycan biosynthesis transport protein ExoP
MSRHHAGPIRLSCRFPDADPETARIATKAVIESYETIRREYELLTFGERESKLEELRDEYQRQRDERRRLALDRALNVAGTDDLQRVERQRLEELSRIGAEVAEAETALARLGTGQATADLIALEDPVLAQLQDELDGLQQVLETKLDYFTPEHREVKWIMSQIRAVETRIERRTEELVDSASNQAEPNTSAADALSNERAAIEVRLQDLDRLKREAESSLTRIARTRLDVLALQQEADEANDRFEDAERRLESLRVEKQAQIVGRVRLAQEPERPLQPSTDRRVPLAAMGLLGGGGTGVAAVAAFGLLFPRLRVAEDAASANGDFAMLGLIPTLPDVHAAGDDSYAQESFHFIRVLLDARTRAKCIVASVTSPSAGDGKTTIALNLARSFATAHRRVLLIDADLVGRGLTRTLGVEPNELGDATEIRLDQLVLPLEDEQFDFLPATDTDGAAATFCGQVLQRALETARERYDVILIDTGPILGSIEAAAVTPAVDQVLLVASRGQESRLLKMSVTRLRDLHAASVGVIFNRATSVDFSRSFGPGSSISRSRREGAASGLAPKARDQWDGRDRGSES